MGRLTTHVLDTANGRPAAGVGIRVFRLDGERRAIAADETNADGRTGRALLEGDTLTGGRYEIEFDIGEYFARHGTCADDPAFLETVVVRVRLDSEGNYHVPLLASPWSYTTYRGS